MEAENLKIVSSYFQYKTIQIIPVILFHGDISSLNINSIHLIDDR